MTNENAKKERNESFDFIKKNYEDEKANLRELTKQAVVDLDDIENKLALTTKENEHEKLWNRRQTIATRMWLASASALSLNQDYMLAIMVRQLEDKIDGLKPSHSLNETAKQLKKEQAAEDKFDEHVAKRLSQLFEMKGHEGMYDTGTKPSRSN